MRNVVVGVVFLIGLASVAYGAWRVYEPAGFIVGGLELVAASVLYVRGGE